MENVIFTSTATAIAIVPWVSTTTWQNGFYGKENDKK